MDIESIKKLLGLPPEATEEQVMTAIKAGAQAVEDLAAERTKAEAAETPARASAGSRPTGPATTPTQTPPASAT